MSVAGRSAELFQLDRSSCIALLGVQHVPGTRDCVIRIGTERVTGRLLRGAVTPTPTGEGGYL